MRVALVGLAVVLLVRPAHADIASSVYDDVRDVVEELIQTEVTTSVVATIETRSPALAFYMHGTLERLGSPYWGSLGRVLKDDLTVAVADFVYWHLSTGGGDGDIVGSAKRFFKCVVQTPGAAMTPGCERLIAAVRVQGRPLLEVECRRTKPPAERRVACDIGLAVLAALQHRGEVRHHVLDALGDIVFAELGDSGLGDRMREILTQWLDRPKDLPSSLLEALANPDLASQLSDDAINELCDDPKTIDSILHDSATSKGWICFAVTQSSLPKALGAKVTIADNGHALDVHLDYWVIEAALKDYDADRANDDTSFRLMADLAFDGRCPAGANIEGWPCQGTRLAPGATITVDWLGRQIVGTVDAQSQIVTKPNRGMMLKLLRFRKAIHRVEDLRALVPPSLSGYLFFGGSPSRESKQVLRAMSRMARVVTELRARWYLVASSAAAGGNTEGGNAELDIAELLHVAQSSLGAVRESAHEAANAATSAVRAGEDKANDIAIASLSFLDKTAVGGAASLDIGDWLRMVMRADYRSLAMESLRAALDIPLHDANRPRETFFLTLAAYLLDTGEGVNEAVARSAFRAAAKELLLSTTHRGVPRVGDRWRFRLLPSLSLRLSFNDAYAITDNNTKRNMIAADWPTAMFAITDYIGLQGSLLDPIAPLGEMALRPAGTYHDQSYILLDALRPRLGAWIAVPQLSRRLALSIGFGARFLSLTRETGPTDLTVHYSAKTSLVFDAGVQFVF